MDADKTTVLIESFELIKDESISAFKTRINTKLKIVASNPIIPQAIKKLLADKTPAVTELTHNINSLLDSSNDEVSDPSKLKDKDELYIQIYVDYKDHLKDADLTEANLTGANLYKANLSGANLTLAKLTDAYLTDAYLTEAKLNGANLTDATLTDATLTDADFTNADLTNADLTDAKLNGANFTDAVLTGAKVSDITIFNNVKTGTITQTQKDSVDDQSAP